VLDTNDKYQRGTELNNGLPSPEATPAVDEGRIDADNARRAAEAKKNNQEERPKDDDEQNGEGDDDDTDERKKDPTEEQSQAIREILKLKKKAYRKILRVKDKYDTKEKEDEEILMAFRTLGTLIHPDYISAKKAKDAFEREWRFPLNPLKCANISRIRGCGCSQKPTCG